jgi:hypothetical protein
VSERDPVLGLLGALVAVVLARRPPAAAARVGRQMLERALATRSSVIIEVHFTGFVVGGEPFGRGSAEVLRAAGRLIVLRLARLGLTAEAGEGDLHRLFEILALPPAALAERGGLAAALAAAAPRGVYAATTAGELYKPPPAPSASTPPPPPLAPPPAEAPPAPAPSSTAVADRAVEEGIEDAIRSLAGAPSLAAFQEVAGAIAQAVASHLSRGELAEAVPLVQALVEEADRQEREAPFREAARRHLHGVVNGRALAGLTAAVERGEAGAREMIGMLPALGEEAAEAFEALLVRSDDRALCAGLFRALGQGEGGRERLLALLLAEARGPRSRHLFALASLPGLEPGLVRRLAEAAASHSDPAVRLEGARAAAALGGREGLRILIGLLGDRKRVVKLEAVRLMASLGDPAVVPPLEELLEEGADEEVEIAAVEALGASRVSEAIPPLLAMLGRRQLFSGKRLQKRKLAAVRALGMLRDRRAHEVLARLAFSRDTTLAAEAARVVKGNAGAR